MTLTKDNVSYCMEVMFTRMVQLSFCGALNSSLETRVFARQRRSQAASVELPAANTIGPDKHVMNHVRKSRDHVVNEGVCSFRHAVTGHTNQI